MPTPRERIVRIGGKPATNRPMTRVNRSASGSLSQGASAGSIRRFSAEEIRAKKHLEEPVQETDGKDVSVNETLGQDVEKVDVKAEKAAAKEQEVKVTAEYLKNLTVKEIKALAEQDAIEFEGTRKAELIAEFLEKASEDGIAAAAAVVEEKLDEE